MASDQRRKIAHQRNLQHLSEARTLLDRYQHLVGGIVAILRADGQNTVQDLIGSIRSGVDLTNLAVHVRNAMHANPAVEQAFSAIEFAISDGDERPLISDRTLMNLPLPTNPALQSSAGAQASTHHPAESSRTARTGRHWSGMIQDMINPPLAVPAHPWTTVTTDDEFVSHLISLWFTWAHPWWHWVDEQVFLMAMKEGDANSPICTTYLVNMILADSCLLDVLDDDDNFSNIQLRDQFYAEAVRELDIAGRGTASLAFICALGVQWTFLITNGRDKLGHAVLHNQRARYRELGEWRAQLQQNPTTEPETLNKIDRCLERLTWTMFALDTISALSSDEISPRKSPDWPRPIHNPQVGGIAHVDNSDTPWMPYPEPRKLKSPFHPECHYSSFLSLAEVTAQDEALLPQGGGQQNVELDQLFYERYTQLENWSLTLPQCMQLGPQATPHVLILHALHHWTVLSISNEAAAAEAGYPLRTKIFDIEGIWLSRSLDSARAIGNLMTRHYQEWGNNYFPVMVTQPLALAVFTLMDDLQNDQSRSAFVSLLLSLHAAARRFWVCKGVILLVQSTALTRGIDLPKEVEELFVDEHERVSSPNPQDTAHMGVDYLLGKWDDFELK